MSGLVVDEVREQVSEQEWAVRVDLAACYRMVALQGWDESIFTHISARVPGSEHFLINPYGAFFDEITASSLVKVDADCNKLLPSEFPVNPAGFVIHGAVHEARPDALCVLHVHTVAGTAVAAQAGGLLPISQHATVALASLGYHDYEGIAVRAGERERLAANLGGSTSLILRNHGLLTVGPTVADAYLWMANLQKACEIQVAAQAGGGALVAVPQAIVDGVKANIEIVTKGAGGSLAWPATLRRLDRIDPSYRL